MFKSIFNPFLSAIFVVISQILNLNRKNCMFFACSLLNGCSRTSFRTQTVFSPNFSPNPDGFLSEPFSELSCFHYEWGLQLWNQIVIFHFKRYFRYTLYTIYAWFLSCIRQKIGLLIKLWLNYRVFWTYQHLSRLFFVTLPSNNRNLSWQS